MTKRIFLITLAFSIAYFVDAHKTGAQATLPVEAEFALGLDGQCKFGQWVPVRITLSTQDEAFAGHIVLSYSQVQHSLPVDLVVNGQKVFSTQIRLDETNVNQQVVFSLESAHTPGEQVELAREDLVCSAGRLIGVLTDTPSAFTALNRIEPISSTATAYLTPATLPGNALGLQILDVLILANTDSSRLTPAQRTAIRQWVAQGGHLLFGGGAQWQNAVAGFEELLPLAVTGAHTAEILTGLAIQGPPFQMADVVLLEGALIESSKILLHDENQPLVTQRTYGAGAVTLLAFDPQVPAFQDWEYVDAFYTYLLKSTPGRSDFLTVKDWNTAVTVASAFSTAGLPSPWLIGILVVLYALIIGPGNFLLLRRMDKPGLAWFSIPLVSLAFMASLIALGWDLRGSKARLNHLAIVHQWPDHDMAAVNAFVGAYAPARDSLEIHIQGDFVPYAFAPHHYYNTPNNEWRFTRTSSFLAQTHTQGAEVMPLGFQGSIPAIPFHADLEMHIRSASAALVGVLENHSTLDFSDSLLVFPGGVKFLGPFPSGEAMPLDLPVDIHMQKSTRADAALYGQVYNPFTLSGTPILDSQATRIPAIAPQDKKRTDLLSAVFGSNTFPAAGFLFIGWEDSGSVYELDLVEQEFDSEYLTAYMLSLQVKIVPQEPQLLLPPAFFTWFISETSSVQNMTPYALRFGFQDVVELAYRQVLPIADARPQELVLHLEGEEERPDFPLEVQIWNLETDRWQDLPITRWGDHFLAEPTPFIDALTSEVRIRLNENGNGGGVFTVSRADISLVLEP